MRYRKLPVEIDAMQFDGTHECAQRIAEWMDINASRALYFANNLGESSFLIVTLEGDMEASPGDYIIRGVKGEYYPCKPDIFEATYEAIS